MLCGEFDERPLDGLVATQLLPEDDAFIRVRDAAVDAELRGAARGRRLADTVFVREGLRDGEAVVDGTEDGGRGDADVREGDGGVVGGHVEGPFEGLNFHAWCRGWDDEGGDALGTAILAGCAGEDERMCGGVHASLPAFVAVDFVAVLTVLELDGLGACVHVGSIGSVVDLSQTKSGAKLSAGGEWDEMIALFFGTVVVHHDDKGVVAND